MCMVDFKSSGLDNMTKAVDGIAKELTLEVDCNS